MPPQWKIVWYFFQKLNIKLPFYPAIQILHIYPREMKMYIHAKICTALFRIDKGQKQCKCLSVDV